MPVWAKRENISMRALQYCPEAIDTLVWHMRNSDNPAIRVTAADRLLDRGLGKAMRNFDGSGNIIGKTVNVLQVVTGVPEPDPVLAPEPEPEIMIGDEEPRRQIEIEGEVVKE